MDIRLTIKWSFFWIFSVITVPFALIIMYFTGEDTFLNELKHKKDFLTSNWKEMTKQFRGDL